MPPAHSPTDERLRDYVTRRMRMSPIDSVAPSRTACSPGPWAAANAAARAVAQQIPHQCALEVDHIIPGNARCIAGKRDTDRTDFRGLLASYQHRQEARSRVLLENEPQS